MKNQGENMEEKKCFADLDGRCTALSKKKCKNCNFYRTDLDRFVIEYQIKNYGGRIKRENI